MGSVIFWRVSPSSADCEFLLLVHAQFTPSNPCRPPRSGGRRNRTSRNRPPLSKSEPEYATPPSESPSLGTASLPRRATTGSTPHNLPPTSPEPVHTYRVLGSPASIVPTHPVNTTPPTPTSILSYSDGHERSIRTPRRGERDRRVATVHTAPVNDDRVVDRQRLVELVHLIKLQDPTIETEHKIHSPRPSSGGTRRRWYVVRYGREVGVFNDWYVLHTLNETRLTTSNRHLVNAATCGVSGGSQESADSEEIGYIRFFDSLNAGMVCIANWAPPYVARY